MDDTLKPLCKNCHVEMSNWRVLCGESLCDVCFEMLAAVSSRAFFRAVQTDYEIAIFQQTVQKKALLDGSAQ